MTTTPQNTDPFASSTGAPSVSFKDAPIGTSFTGTVTQAPTMVQARDYETGQPAFWPDGNPKMTVVTTLVDANGEEHSLWAPKPSSMFAAIAAAQQAAGAQIAVGGVLTVTFVGETPNKSNPRLNPAKQYTASYRPPAAFGEPSQPVPAVASVPPVQQPVQAQPMQAQPMQQAPAQQAPAQQPGATPQPTQEQVAAVKAIGLDPAVIFPGYVA